MNGTGQVAGTSVVNRVLVGVDRTIRAVVIAIVAAMVAIVGIQVALRYLFNISLDWADEVSRLAFVWMMFMGIPLAARAKAHIAIDLLAHYLPRAARRWSARLLPLGCAVIALIVAWEAAVLIWDQWDELMASLDWSAQWFIVPVALGMAISALFFVEQAFWPLPEVIEGAPPSEAASAILDKQRNLS